MSDMEQHPAEHKRPLTFVHGIALYMAAVLGSGILILPGYTAETAGPASIVSWIILSVLSVPIAYSFARLALKYENYGGIATIVQQAFGRVWSAVVGWFFFVWVATGEAVVGLTGAAYIVAAFDLPAFCLHLIAFLFIAAALLFNAMGMRVSGLASLVLSGTVLVLLLVTISFAVPVIRPEAFVPFAPEGLGGIGRACVLIFWAFFGWESITHLVPEFRNPKRDVMRSTWASVFLIGIVYVMLSVVTVGTHTYGGEGTVAPLSLLMNRTLGISAGTAAAIVAGIVCLGTLNVYLAGSSRLGYALARERKLPAWFARMNRTGFPYRTGLFFFGTNTLVLIVSYIWHVGVDTLILIPTSLGIFVYIIAACACIRLLWHDRVGRIAALTAAAFCLILAPFAAGYLLVPVIVAAACLLYLRFNRQSASAENNITSAGRQ